MQNRKRGQFEWTEKYEEMKFFQWNLKIFQNMKNVQKYKQTQNDEKQLIRKSQISP